jgi:aldose 1-epimerase
MLKKNLNLISASALLVVCASCAGTKADSKLTESGLDPQNFVSQFDGKETALYTLKNANGMEVCITNFGGRVVSVMVPDRDGKMTDVVLGYDNIAQY